MLVDGAEGCVLNCMPCFSQILCEMTPEIRGGIKKF